MKLHVHVVIKGLNCTCKYNVYLYTVPDFIKFTWYDES